MVIELIKNIQIPPPKKCANSGVISDFKLYFLLQFAFTIEAVKAKAKTRWYYNRFPKPIVAGFTLAEVLLTLTIIAVVAFLTIPPLENSVAQLQYNTGVQVANQMLSQAVEQIQINNGVVRVGPLGDWTTFQQDFCSVLNCVRVDTATNLYSAISNPFYYSYYKGGSNGWNIAAAGRPVVILNNGMYLLFNSYATCSPANTSNPGGNINACGDVYVDINGSQGPNMNGADFFDFWVVLQNGTYSILPVGAPGDGNSCYIGSWNGCTYQRLYNPNGMP